jgi:hypothetical protein
VPANFVSGAKVRARVPSPWPSAVAPPLKERVHSLPLPQGERERCAAPGRGDSPTIPHHNFLNPPTAALARYGKAARVSCIPARTFASLTQHCQNCRKGAFVSFGSFGSFGS